MVRIDAEFGLFRSEVKAIFEPFMMQFGGDFLQWKQPHKDLGNSASALFTARVYDGIDGVIVKAMLGMDDSFKKCLLKRLECVSVQNNFGYKGKPVHIGFE